MNRPKITVLCEDKQHASFIRRFFKKRNSNDKVAVFVPMRNVETWLAYLNGDPVNETDSYPRLERERDCRKQADALVQMCDKGKLNSPAPTSLEAACREYRNVF